MTAGVSDRGLQWYQTVGQYEQEQQTGMAVSMRSTRNSNMDISKLSKSKYLKTTDVPDPVLVTVQDVSIQNVAMQGDPKENRPIVTFKELEKPMVFNATNLKRAAKAFDSTETDDWIGKKLVVYTDDEVEFAGEIVGGLRVRAPKPPKRAEPEEETEPAPKRGMAGIQGMQDDVPFADPYKGRLAYVI
jgi:hypothetical protein